MKKPKILLWDIETLPNIGYCWGRWEQNIIKFVKEWEIASFAYKWLGENKIHCFTRWNNTEKALVQKMWDLIDQADITIAHNGDQFDLKKAKTKFLQYGLKPTALSKSIDTKKVAKGQFSFNSNSLNDLAEFLELGEKAETGGFDLWLRCMGNDKNAWAKMAKYNKMDVRLLERIYLKMRPWITNHPSISALINRPGCHVCGATSVAKAGVRATTRTLQQRWKCNSCGHSFTGQMKKSS